MIIFGVVHADPDSLRKITDRFASSPDAKGCDKIAGDGFSFWVKAMRQPGNGDGLWSGYGLHVALSGEISNRADLAAAASSAQERPLHPVPHATLFADLYRRFGSACVSKTSGHFCASAWDAHTQELRLFLDRTGGIKALYYAKINGGFAFCSSLALLMSSLQLSKELDEGLVRGLFSTGYILPPRTLFKGVCKMRPGEEVLYHDGKVTSRIVDRIRFDSSPNSSATADDLASLIVNSIANLSTDPETGFLLSGGIDTGVLVALAAQRLNKPVKTYCGAFPGSSLDESAYARIVADANHCPCERVNLNRATALDDLPEILWHLGEPFLDFSAIPCFHLFKEVRQQTGIAICGDGPDHLFGRYLPLAAKRYAGKRYRTAIRLLSLLPAAFPHKVLNAAEASLFDAYKGLFSIPAWGADAGGSLSGLLNIAEHEESGIASFFAGMDIPAETDLAGFLDALATVDFHVDGSCGVFAKVGRMAAAHGLTMREPYLDRRVSDYIARLPLHQKRGGTLLHHLAGKSRAKVMLKYGIGTRYLPSEIINKKKGGFVPPLSGWLRETICGVPSSRLLCQTLRRSGILNVPVFERMLKEHAHGVRDWARIIFMVVSFDLWVRLFVESDYGAFPGWKLTDLYEQDFAHAFEGAMA